MTILRQQRINVLDESAEAPQPHVPEPWTARAKCLDDMAPYFPRQGKLPAGYAESLCAGCPVVEECLAAALDHERDLPLAMRHGVWGGTTPTERFLMQNEVVCRACPVAHTLTLSDVYPDSNRIMCREAQRIRDKRRDRSVA